MTHPKILDGGQTIALTVQARGKLNLFLEALGRRPDGYHEIESLMATVDLSDELTLTLDPSGAITLECDDPSLPTDERNLVIRAATLLRRESGTSSGALIQLGKKIPAQAGLGGGSSDASSTLSALNELWGLNWSGERLDSLAASIGSDVPFFRQGPAAICRGRGELVSPVGLKRPLWLVLVCPMLGLSTAEVYSHLKLKSNACDSPRSIAPMLEAFASGEPEAIGPCLFNRLQGVAETIAPQLTQIRDALANLGPSLLCGSLMSGSGSAYFGLARDQDAAMEAERLLARSLAKTNLLAHGRVRVVACGP